MPRRSPRAVPPTTRNTQTSIARRGRAGTVFVGRADRLQTVDGAGNTPLPGTMQPDASGNRAITYIDPYKPGLGYKAITYWDPYKPGSGVKAITYIDPGKPTMGDKAITYIDPYMPRMNTVIGGLRNRAGALVGCALMKVVDPTTRRVQTVLYNASNRQFFDQSTRTWQPAPEWMSS